MRKEMWPVDLRRVATRRSRSRLGRLSFMPSDSTNTTVMTMAAMWKTQRLLSSQTNDTVCLVTGKRTDQPSEYVIYVLMIGPNTRPRLAITAHKKTIQIRSSVSNRSSMEPAMITVGTEDRTPVIKRPIITAAKFGTSAIITQKMQYRMLDRV